MVLKNFGRARGLLSGLVLVILVGCSAMPVQGPTVREITESSQVGKNFVLVDLSPGVLSQLDHAGQPSLVQSFGNAAPAPIVKIESGDIVAVTIWDAGGGLFSPQGAAMVGTQQTTIPNQIVDPDGRITVPFAGQIQVAGKSTIEAQRAIVRALSRQALQPQALVSMVEDRRNLITIVGDVKTPIRMTLEVNGTHLLDALARAGGTTAPAFDTVVQLTRRGVAKRVRLSWLLANPAENIYLQPDDVVYVVRDPETVAVLGATKENLHVSFQKEQMTLSDIVAQSGGLLDIQAEPTGVFVFRMEPGELVHRLKPGAASNSAPGAAVPVIFRANLREPQGYFLAQSFEIKDKDIVYVADAEFVQVNKLLVTILRSAEIAGIFFRGGGVTVSSP
jgi:polysaccharide biosynthesis/export protein